MSYALVMMTDPGNPEANGRMVHLLKSATTFRDAGEDVAIHFHGAAVNWAGAFAAREDRFTQHYGELFDEVKPLIAGACSFCSKVRFQQTEAVDALGLRYLGDEDSHETAADLVLAGKQVITF